MMELTKQEFQNECLFSVTMSHVRSMLKKGLISQDEYCQMRDKMKQKYHPVSDGLISETDLQATENRGLIRRKRLSGDRLVKSIHAILYNTETGGYTVYGRAVANSRGVYTVFRMELDSRMNQLSLIVRSVDFYQDYNFSVTAAPGGDAYVYCRTYDETYVQPVLVPFNVLEETEPHGLRLH